MRLFAFLIFSAAALGIQIGRGVVEVAVARMWWRLVRSIRGTCTIAGCAREAVYDLGDGYDKVCPEHL